MFIFTFCCFALPCLVMSFSVILSVQAFIDGCSPAEMKLTIVSAHNVFVVTLVALLSL